jgi:NAD(P)-dependent dehydrogenase (short-subunit alcohol dehydrogenase family)
MDEQKPEVWQQVMQVNVNGTFMLTQALLPLLLKSESGSLVFTSSSVGRQGAPTGAPMPPPNSPPKA